MRVRENTAIDPQTQALRFANVSLTTGVRLHYAEQGDPNGQPIILLHGYADSWFSFSRVLPLMDTAYHVYTLDRRGYGDSDRPASGYTVSDHAADVVAFMDAMGLQSATIVGHSGGSLVAQQLALDVSERVTRLVLIGSASNVRSEAVKELQQAVNTLEDPVPVDFVREFQASTTYHPVPDGFFERVVAESLKVPARVWREALAGYLAVDYTAQLGRVQAPTLILQGEQDVILPQAARDALAARIAGAVLKVYPETGHDPQWERPEQFIRDLEDFIART